MSIVPYADTTYAFAYFADRLNTDPWDSSSLEDKIKALKMATRAIDRLNLAGEKHDTSLTAGVPTQPNQFPRGNDTVVPTDIQDACCEIAFAFLDGVDPVFEIENMVNIRQGIGDSRVERDSKVAQEWLAAGIPSVVAWHILQAYLADGYSIDVTRA